MKHRVAGFSLLWVAFLQTACSQVAFAPGSLKSNQSSMSTPAVPPTLPQTENFQTVQESKVISPAGKLDILFVADFTASMTQNLQTISARLATISTALQGYDWQAAVTSSGMGTASLINPYDQYGKFLPFLRDYYYYPTLKTSFSSSDANFDYFFPWTLLNPEPDICSNTTAAWCQISPPEGLKATIAALQLPANNSFFRAGAYFVPVILSNSDEGYTGGTSVTQPAAVGAAFAAGVGSRMAGMIPVSFTIRPNDTACLTNQQQPSVETLTGHAQVATVTNAFVNANNGVAASVCDTDYGAAFAKIDPNIRLALSYIDLQNTPVNSTPVVTLTPAPASATTWTLQGNRITFAQALPAHTTISVQYQIAK